MIRSASWCGEVPQGRVSSAPLLTPLTAREQSALWAQHRVLVTPTATNSDHILDALHFAPLLGAECFQTATQQRVGACDMLLSQIDGLSAQLDELTTTYNQVTTETRDFQQAAQALVERHRQIAAVQQEVEEAQRRIDTLDKVTAVLNNPHGGALVRKQLFRDALADLDASLAFVAAHPDYRGVEMYAVRFRHCMTRALTLIRQYVVSGLRRLEQETVAELRPELLLVTRAVLVYTTFGDQAEQYASLVLEIATRAKDHSEYLGLLEECFNQYARTRSVLVGGTVAAGSDKPLALFLQDTLSLVTRLVEDEYAVFVRVFWPGPGDTPQQPPLVWFAEWLRLTLCAPMYTAVRQRVIREQDVDVLCELATLLQKYYEFEDDAGVSTVSLPLERKSGVDLGMVFRPVLEDVQRRMVFRVQVFIDENISKYVPSMEDFPNVGRRHRALVSVVEGTVAGDGDAEDGSVGDDNTGGDNTEDDNAGDDNAEDDSKADLTTALFPPLASSVHLLSQIYQLVNSLVFDDLAHYVLHACIHVLKTSAYSLAARTMGKADALLFVMGNYIALQQQVSQFDIEYAHRETLIDFSGVAHFVAALAGRAGDRPASFLELARGSVPRVVNNMVDARAELAGELRTCVHDYIAEVVQKRVLYPLAQPADLVDAVLNSVVQLRANLDAELPLVHALMAVCIPDQQIVDYLVSGILEMVVARYSDYYAEAKGRFGNDPRFAEVMEMDGLVWYVGRAMERE